MTVKASKTTIVICIICFICMNIAALVEGDWIFAVLFTVVIGVMIIDECIVVGRTFILDETGCTVCFLGYKKKYYWKDMKVKCLENCRNSIGYKGCPYQEAAYFSTHKIHKPKWMQPLGYNRSTLHPFSFIFVYFSVEKGDKMYEVDEVEFKEKMKEWGVELSGSTESDAV